MTGIHKHFVRALLGALLVAGVWPTCAAAFSELVVFGDSLSDIGNISQATFELQPGPYYYSGRFSNGPVYAEAVATGLGLAPLARSTAGGGDFAYGGAKTTGTGGLEGLFIRDVDEQVDTFLASRTADPDALFLVLAGANDLIDGQTNVNVPVGQLTTDITRLIDAGARQFLVLNLPLLGLVPRYNGNPTQAVTMSSLTSQFNAALADALEGLEDGAIGLTIHRLDVAALINQVVSSPAAFGLANVTDSAAPGLEPGDSSYDTGQIVSEPDAYLFWDDLHPTTAAHAMLAEQALLALRLAGDYNDDGVVDAADYTVWRDAFGQMGAGLAADGDANGAVNGADYSLWKENFGAVSASGSRASGVTLVPEPATLVLVALAAVVIAAGSDKRCANLPAADCRSARSRKLMAGRPPVGTVL
jgi:phospholipase/lecithinase/hemolysin